MRSHQCIASEIILVDRDERKCLGQAKDLGDVLGFAKLLLCAWARTPMLQVLNIVIICAGVAQSPGESRRDLLQKNAAIISSICTELKTIKSDALVIIVTNPLDSLTLLAQRLLPLEKGRVFGSGTWLETQRLRRFLAARFDVSPHSIEAFMIGEHGDSAVAIIPDYLNLTHDQVLAVQHDVVQEVYTILDFETCNVLWHRCICYRYLFCSYSQPAPRVAGFFISCIIWCVHEFASHCG